jgi:vitamin B12 transporter
MRAGDTLYGRPTLFREHQAFDSVSFDIRDGLRNHVRAFEIYAIPMKRYFLALTISVSISSPASVLAEPVKKLSELPTPTQSAQGLQDGGSSTKPQEVSPSAPESENVPKTSSDEDVPLFEPRVKNKQTGPSQTAPSYSIPRAEIQKKGAQNLGQTLRGAPGFALNDVGRGADIHTGNYYRGRSLNDSIILLNGRPISNKINTYHGGTDLNALPVESIENVELSSGASSTLYGSEGAFSGVVNVIPREGVGPPQLNAKVEFGSLGQSDYRASYGGSDDKVSYLFSFQDSTSENNYPVPFGSTNRDPNGRFFNSGTSLTSYSANVSLELDQRNTLSFDTTKIVSRKGLLYTFNPALTTLNRDKLDHDGWNVGLSWKSLLTENGDSTLTTTLGYNQDYFNTYGPTGDSLANRTGTLDTKQLTARVEHQLLTSSTNTLRYGVDLQNNQLIGTVTGTSSGPNVRSGNGPTEDRSILNTSLFLLDTWNISRDLTLELGGRGSFSGQFGSYFNPSAGLRWAVSPGVTARASWAGAQRNPGLDQLYVFDTVHNWIPNANLRPETGSSWNAGLDVQFSPDVTGKFTYYGSSISNRLSTERVGKDSAGNDQSQWKNIGGVEVGGFESALKWQVAPQWATFLNYTYTDARILSGQDRGLQDSLIPYSVAQAGIGYQHEGWQVNLIANHSSGSRRAFFNLPQAGESTRDFSAPFVTLDLTGRVPLSRTTAVNVYLENLGGASFERVNRIYTPPGIVYRMGLETTF